MGIELCLAYVVQVGGNFHKIHETVHLVKADSGEGGKWRIVCPAIVNGEACAKPVDILYLPPSQKYFACRHCHDLAYPWKKADGAKEGVEMNEIADMRGNDGQESSDIDCHVGEDSARSALGEAPAERPDGDSPSPLRLRSSAYIDHAVKHLDPQNTILSEDGRMKLVDELLAKMLQDDGLPEERFSQAVTQVQFKAPVSFAGFATRILREGNFSVRSDQGQAYFTFHRLGKILRLHLVEDLDIKRAADLLLLDAAVEALIQSRILLNSADSGPSQGEERLLRTQAVQQQKLFMSAMDKLTPKPMRRMGRPPVKESA
jgi:hypothetical protein